MGSQAHRCPPTGGTWTCTYLAQHTAWGRPPTLAIAWERVLHPGSPTSPTVPAPVTARGHPLPWLHTLPGLTQHHGPMHRTDMPYPIRPGSPSSVSSPGHTHCSPPTPSTAQGHPPPQLHALPRDTHRPGSMHCPGMPTVAPSFLAAQEHPPLPPAPPLPRDTHCPGSTHCPGTPTARLHTLPRDAHRCPQLPRCPGTPTATPGSEWYLCT